MRTGEEAGVGRSHIPDLGRERVCPSPSRGPRPLGKAKHGLFCQHLWAGPHATALTPPDREGRGRLSLAPTCQACTEHALHTAVDQGQAWEKGRPLTGPIGDYLDRGQSLWDPG